VMCAGCLVPIAFAVGCALAGCRARLAAAPPVAGPAVAIAQSEGRLTRSPPETLAEEADACPRWTFSAEAGLYSKYVWRGLLIGDDPVVQGSVTAVNGDFSLNVWGNLDLTDVHDTENELNEVDITPDFTHRIKETGVPLDLSLGAIAYLFPATDTGTILEVYAALSADVFLEPAITVRREVRRFDYTYVSLDVGHTFDFGCWELELDGGVGWGNARWHEASDGKRGAGLHDVSMSVAAVIPRGRWSFVPKIWYSSLLGSELRGTVDKPDLWVAALIVDYSF